MGVMPKLRRILQVTGATAPFQGPHGHKHTLGPILRKVHFNTASPVTPADASDLNYLVARRQLECDAGFPVIHPRTVLWSNSIWDVLELSNRSQLSRRRNP